MKIYIPPEAEAQRKKLYTHSSSYSSHTIANSNMKQLTNCTSRQIF